MVVMYVGSPMHDALAEQLILLLYFVPSEAAQFLMWW